MRAALEAYLEGHHCVVIIDTRRAPGEGVRGPAPGEGVRGPALGEGVKGPARGEGVSGGGGGEGSAGGEEEEFDPEGLCRSLED